MVIRLNPINSLSLTIFFIKRQIIICFLSVIILEHSQQTLIKYSKENKNVKQNKNKFFFLAIVALLLVFLAFSFSGCVPPVPEVINVTGVDITEDDQSIKVGDTLQLTAVVTPEDADNKAITWESDNPDVASVDEDGLVTALSTGVANITVTTEDGAFTDTIKITVTSQSSGGGNTPAPEKYEITLGAVEVNTPLPPSSFDLNSSLIRQITTPEADIAGVEIEIFSNEERTNSVVTITTGQEGIATVKLPKGIYYYTASAEGYVDFLSEIYQYFSDTSVIPKPEPNVFLVDGPSEDVNLFPMLKVWKVSFLATKPSNSLQLAGLSRTDDPGLPLEGVNIDIFVAVVSSAGRTVERGTIPPLISISTGSDGTVETELPNGGYSYNASKEGYADYPPKSPGNIFSIQRPLVIDRGYFEIQGVDVAGTIQVPMEPVYTITFKVTDQANSNPIQDAQISVFSDSEKNISIGTTQTTDTNGEATLDVDLTGGTTYYYTVTAYGYQDNECSFTTPAEDVTVTITLEDASCPQAGYIYNEGANADDWKTGIDYPSGDFTEQSKESDHLYLYAKTDSMTSQNTDIAYSTTIPIDLTCINSIVIDWENTGSDSDSNHSHLVVASSYNDWYYNSTKQFSKQSSFLRKTNELDKLDVSDLTGTHYIRVHAQVDAGSNCESVIKVYSIELSEEMVDFQ